MNYLILVVGFIYACIGIDQYLKGEHWQLMIYLGYAFSNIGLFMLSK